MIECLKVDLKMMAERLRELADILEPCLAPHDGRNLGDLDEDIEVRCWLPIEHFDRLRHILEPFRAPRARRRRKR